MKGLIMPIVIQPMRKVTAPIIFKDAMHQFEVMKDLRPKKQPRILYFRCGASGNPPPNGNDDINIFKRQFSPEEIARIEYACKGNLLTKEYLSILNYNKKF